MREIEFRGKRVDNGEWVYGDLVRIPRDCGGYNEPPSLALKVCITDSHSLNKNPIEVIPETVGQYIGRKDKNGKEIYNGDITRVVNTEGTVLIRQVVWNEDKARFDIGSLGYCEIVDSAYFVLQYCVEVIGNVTDNPELIKGEV